MNAAAAHTVCPRHCDECGLRRTAAFSPVNPSVLSSIERLRSGTHLVPAGGTLIRERQPNVRLYTLYAGWAFRYKTLSDGRRQILNFLLPGDLAGLQQQFGETSLHGVDAITDCHFCVFEEDTLWELYKDHSRLGYEVTWLAAREESLVDDNLLTAGRRTAPERVAVLLLQLHRRLDRLGLVDADGSVAFPVTQQHIADALGLSLVHTNKTLRRLAQLGLHDLSGGRLRILNARVLARIAEVYDTVPRQAPLL